MFLIVVIMTVDGMIQQQPYEMVILPPYEWAELAVFFSNYELDKALIHDEIRRLCNVLDFLHRGTDNRGEEFGQCCGRGGLVKRCQIGEDGRDTSDAE